MWKSRQRVVSSGEPEIGLGTIEAIDLEQNIVRVYFEKIDEERTYALRKNPLKRHIFQANDVITTLSNQSHTVLSYSENEGIIQYQCEQKAQIWEYEIHAHTKIQQNPIDALVQTQLEPKGYVAYDLRKEAAQITSKLLGHQACGLVGPRVQPLPHQIYIANEVAKRNSPKVLLSDEVGLGKTIEAGLIYSKLRAKGLAHRVLLIVPDSLIHQWIFEMYRRFNELFSLIDENRTQEEPDWLLRNSKIVTSFSLFEKNPSALQAMMSENLDLLIIDEAHHLRWDEESPSGSWEIANLLTEHSSASLLLTATPKQKGLLTQFGLLNIIDPSRFSDYEEFLTEQENMQGVSQLVKKIEAGSTTKADLEQIKELTDTSLSQSNAKEVINQLVDRHGTGRVLFRNRRENIKGFPKRTLSVDRLETSPSYQQKLAQVDVSLLDDQGILDLATGRKRKSNSHNFDSKDAKFDWLTTFCQKYSDEKLLFICSSKQRAEEYVQALLQANIGQVSCFHEGLSLVDRDKRAAHFFNPNGYRILICSEIGSEGRNFQFVKRMGLLDLPMHPDVLEQRIGRLDRIGQGKEIFIHVPVMQDTPESAFFDWYHLGFQAFERSWNQASTLLERFAEDLLEALVSFCPGSQSYSIRDELLTQLLSNTHTQVKELTLEARDTYDVLLDINSFNEEKGLALTDKIEEIDDDPSLEFLIRNLLDHFGVEYEDYDHRGSILIKPDSLSFIDSFNSLKDDEVVVTFDRDMALKREDMMFLSIDHPFVSDLISELMNKERGVFSIAQSSEIQDVQVQMLFNTNLKGPKDLQLEQYFPSLARELTFNKHGLATLPEDLKLEPVSKHLRFDASSQGFKAILLNWYQKAQAENSSWLIEQKKLAMTRAEQTLRPESERLRYLATINPSVSSDEAANIDDRILEVNRCIEATSLELEAIRILIPFSGRLG